LTVFCSSWHRNSPLGHSSHSFFLLSSPFQSFYIFLYGFVIIYLNIAWRLSINKAFAVRSKCAVVLISFILNLLGGPHFLRLDAVNFLGKVIQIVEFVSCLLHQFSRPSFAIRSSSNAGIRVESLTAIIFGNGPWSQIWRKGAFFHLLLFQSVLCIFNPFILVDSSSCQPLKRSHSSIIRIQIVVAALCSQLVSVLLSNYGAIFIQLGSVSLCNYSLGFLALFLDLHFH
jgi:hypothetical protein